MTQDPYLKKVSPQPPMVAFRRPTNLRDILIKAKVPPPPLKKLWRQLKGMKACNQKPYETCPYVKSGKVFKSPFNSTVVQLNSTLSYARTNMVYCLLCSKENCQQIYIDQTKRQLKERFGEHKTSVRNKSKCTVADQWTFQWHWPLPAWHADTGQRIWEKVYTSTSLKQNIPD